MDLSVAAGVLPTDAPLRQALLAHAHNVVPDPGPPSTPIPGYNQLGFASYGHRGAIREVAKALMVSLCAVEGGKHAGSHE